MKVAEIHEVVVERDGEVQVKGLPVRAGETVELLLLRQQVRVTGTDRYPLHGKPVRYDRPFESALDPEQWEANR